MKLPALFAILLLIVGVSFAELTPINSPLCTPTTSVWQCSADNSAMQGSILNQAAQYPYMVLGWIAVLVLVLAAIIYFSIFEINGANAPRKVSKKYRASLPETGPQIHLILLLFLFCASIGWAADPGACNQNLSTASTIYTLTSNHVDNWTVKGTGACKTGDILLAQDLGATATVTPAYKNTLAILENLSGEASG